MSIAPGAASGSQTLDRVQARLERLGDDPLQLFDVARLDRIAERPALDDVDGLVNGTSARDHDERERGMAHLEPVQQLEPVHAVHEDVTDDGVEGLTFDQLERGGGVRRKLAGVTCCGEQAAQRLPHLGIVVDDEQAGLHGAARKLRLMLAPRSQIASLGDEKRKHASSRSTQKPSNTLVSERRFATRVPGALFAPRVFSIWRATYRNWRFAE